MLTKQEDYRSSLVAHKMRSMELQAGKPRKKGNRRGPTYAYHVEEPGDACRRAGPEGLRTLRRGLAPAPAKERARGRLSPARLE